MAGVLSFTLGIEASNFLRGIGMASGSILSLGGAMDVLRRTFDSTWGVIERGGRLKDLSNRTGESVRSLYLLEEGFKQVGIGADSVSPMLFRLQKALAGVDEMGNKTDDVFASLGLNMNQLRGMDAVARIETVAQALSRVGGDQAAGFAGKLFGREGAGNFLQLMRDFPEFRNTLRDAAGYADLFAKNAERWNTIGNSMTSVRRSWEGLAALLAQALSGAIQKAIDSLQIGLDAIEVGRFGELFKLSLQAGVQAASNLMMNEIMKWEQTGMKESGKHKAGFWSTVGNTAGGAVLGLLGLGDEIGAQLGIPGTREWSDKRFDQAWAMFDKVGVNEGPLLAIADAFTNGIQGLPNEYAVALQQLIDQIKQEKADRANASKPEKATTRSAPTGSPAEKVAASRIDGNTLEKMGFVMTGWRGLENDYARSTADHTRQMVGTLKSIDSRLSIQAGGNWNRIS